MCHFSGTARRHIQFSSLVYFFVKEGLQVSSLRFEIVRVPSRHMELSQLPLLRGASRVCHPESSAESYRGEGAIGRADRSISFNSDALTSLRDIVYVASLLIPTLQAVCASPDQKLGVQFMLDISQHRRMPPL